MKVTLLAAISVDGFIAQSEGQVSTAWTSAADKKWFGEASRKCELVVMGRKTYETMGRPLAGRVNVVLTRREMSGARPMDELTAETKEGLFESDWGAVELVKFLAARGRATAAVCGGASVYAQFIESDLIDDIYLTIEPVLFGAGVKLINHKMYKKFTLNDVIRISDQTTVLHLETGI